MDEQKMDPQMEENLAISTVQKQKETGMSIKAVKNRCFSGIQVILKSWAI